MENIEGFLKYAQFLNHIDFSGMNLLPAQIKLLLQLFKKCKFLVGFHLSDNNITNTDLFEYMISLYNIKEADLNGINKKSCNPRSWDKTGLNNKSNSPQQNKFDHQLS